MATGTFRDSRALAAAASVVNILAGSIYEFLQGPTGIALYAVADPAAASILPPQLTLLLGQAIILQDYPIPVFTAAQGPNRDQHLIGAWMGSPGDRVVLSLRNTDPAVVWNIRNMVEFK